MIKVEHLTKLYGKFKAVDNITVIGEPGEITVLLGDNGAGKSTTIKSIIGLLNYEGNITICGHPNRSVEAKQVFGYIPEVPILYDLLTIQEHIDFIAASHKIANVAPLAEKYLKLFEIEDKRKSLVKELSKGMRQKVSMLLALITEPKALLVDEPLIGLDPQSIENVLHLFDELKQQGVSILISTHIIDVIGELWDKAYIMKKGKVINEVRRIDLIGKKLKDVYFESSGEQLLSEKVVAPADETIAEVEPQPVTAENLTEDTDSSGEVL